MKFFCAIFLCFLLSCTHGSNDVLVAVGSYSLDDEANQQKPIGDLKLSGWTVYNESLIGGKDWLTLFSPKTRQKTFLLPTPEGMSSPVLVYKDRAYFSLINGELVAFALDSQKVIWRAQLSHRSITRPLWSDGRLFIQSIANVVTSLEADTGKVIWNYDGGFPDSIFSRGQSSLLQIDGAVIACLSDGNILALSKDNGSVLRQFTWDGLDRFRSIVAEPFISQGSLFVARNNGDFLVLDTDSFGIRHSKRLGPINVSTGRDHLIFLGTVTGTIHAFDTTTLEEVWVANTGQALSSLMVLGKHLYFAGTRGRIGALNQFDGSQVGQFQVEGLIDQAPFVLDRKVFFATGQDNFYGVQIQH